MAIAAASHLDTPVTQRLAEPYSGKAVSWAAIFVGATAAAALSLVLVILGFGLGLSSVSPWSGNGFSGQTVGISAIVWIAFTQLAASGVGGYLAGRLRTKWIGLHTDEAYFRDTAHGFMAWAVASLATAALLGSALTGLLSVGTKATAAVAGQAAQGAVAMTASASSASSDGVNYFVDSMFRTTDATHAATPTSPATRTEAAKIFAHDIVAGSLADQDRQYLAGVVAQETGLSPADADKRVSDAFAQTKSSIDQAEAKAKETADAARKAAAYASLWMFVGLMLGAFVASFAAIYGGRRRDLMV
jgi:hypothetical protein